MYNAKNYTEQGGENTVIDGTIVINGKMIVDQDADIEGLSANPLQPATANTLGGIKVGDGLSMDDEVLSVDLEPATASTLGGVKVGTGLEIDEGVLSVENPITQADAQEDSEAEELAELVTDFNALLAKLRTAGVIAAE